MITSGGLGPTHDDRTVEAVAEVAGAELAVDEELLATIAAITAGYARRRGTDPALNRDGDRKQALVPRGATVIPPAGTAPGLLLALGAGHVLVLPGPPRELAAVWSAALELAPIAALRARAGTLLRSTLRVYGVGEPAVARAFAAAGGDAGGHAHDDLRAPARGRGHRARRAGGRARRSRRSSPACASSSARPSTRRTSVPLAEHVLAALRERGLHLAVAESCTAGLVGARGSLDIPGSSDVLARRRDRVRERRQAGAARRAGGADRRVRRGLRRMRARRWPRARAPRPGAEVGIAVTGVAGPGGGSELKPVGLVYLHVSAPGAERGQELHLPGDRSQVRELAAVAALQLVRITVS